MDYPQALPRARRAFTLIELLTVVVIIGILAGLVTAAAVRVRATVRKAAHALELKQLEMAMHAYKERFGEFPPDFTWPRTLPTGQQNAFVEAAFNRHMRKAFPRWKGKNPPPVLDQTFRSGITFWLGGIPEIDGNGNVVRFTGFSADPTDPFAEGGSRIGPFFDFDMERIAVVDNQVRYYPTVEAKTQTPQECIWYYRAMNGSYEDCGLWRVPYRSSRTGGWINPQSFQILSPGITGGMFQDASNDPSFPDGPYEAFHLDQMSNFTSGTMEDALP